MAVGALLASLGLFVLRVAASSGAKADARSEVISSSFQFALMLSGKRAGSSTTKTSDSSRTPSRSALSRSSFLRVSPRPSASPARC